MYCRLWVDARKQENKMDDETSKTLLSLSRSKKGHCVPVSGRRKEKEKMLTLGRIHKGCCGDYSLHKWIYHHT